MKNRLYMIWRILTCKKVVLLIGKKRKGLYEMTYAGCDIIEASKIKRLDYENS